MVKKKRISTGMLDPSAGALEQVDAGSRRRGGLVPPG